MLEAERAKGDIKELLQHNARLQADSQEHQSLKGSYNQLLNRSHSHTLISMVFSIQRRFICMYLMMRFLFLCRFNESERLLKELQAAHISLIKQMDTLRKTQDTLRLQHDK